MSPSPTKSRRKPQITYKSPSVGELPSVHLLRPTVDGATLPSIPCDGHSDNELVTPHLPLSHYSKNPLELPLPLYHPFGYLALSSPPLDPSLLGLPVLPRSGDIIRQSSNRARRTAPKLRDLGYEGSNIDTISTTVVAIAVRDKPSPRKRRTAGSKRRRREMDDGDATYPAKRARLPRISGEEHVEDEMGVDIITQGAEGRPLRSRGRVRPQRPSDASESVSSSPGVTPSGEMQASHGEDFVKIKHRPSGDTVMEKYEEREEGELSEEA